MLRKRGEIPIVWTKIIDDHDAIHAWFHVWSLSQLLNICNYQPELFFHPKWFNPYNAVADNRESKAWHFMWIICQKIHMKCHLIFSEKPCFKRSKCWLLQLWLGFLRVNHCASGVSCKWIRLAIIKSSTTSVTRGQHSRRSRNIWCSHYDMVKKCTVGFSRENLEDNPLPRGPITITSEETTAILTADRWAT